MKYDQKQWNQFTKEVDNQYSRVAEEVEVSSKLDLSFATDYRVFLHNDLLVKADGTSMMNSLELRSPLLDVDVVNFSQPVFLIDRR